MGGSRARETLFGVLRIQTVFKDKNLDELIEASSVE